MQMSKLIINIKELAQIRDIKTSFASASQMNEIPSLKNAKKSLRQDINKSIERVIRILPMIIQGNIQEAMKKLHTDISIKE